MERSILFFGANDLGYSCCERLLEKGHNLKAIFTIPKKFSISYAKDGVTNYLFRDFRDLARKFDVPLVEIERNINDQATQDQIKSLRPDLLLVVGWYYMIGKDVRSLAPLGCVGIHNALLPRYRGGAPLNWAMINGEKMVGTTLFHMGAGVDDGDIIAQKTVSVQEDDYIEDVLVKIKKVAIEMLEQALPSILDGTAPKIPQNHALACVFAQRKPEDGKIDWTWDQQRIHNFVRAISRPYPGAFTHRDGHKILIYRGQKTSERNFGPPGTFLQVGDCLSVVTGDGYIYRLLDTETQKM
jgi:methionyl-tRNA formyltransferase